MDKKTFILAGALLVIFLLDLNFAFAAIAPQFQQGEEAISLPVPAAPTEESAQEPIKILIPFPSETKFVSDESESLPAEPAEAMPTTASASEIEIRPADGIMKVFSEDGSAPAETTLVRPSEERELLKITPEQAMPTSGIAIRQSPDGSLEIETQTISASTFLPVKLTGESLRVEVGEKWETVILPSAVETLVKDISLQATQIKRMELVECKPTAGPTQECGVIYEVEAERKTKLLGIIGIKSTLEYEINASSGQIMKEEKPWYLKVLPFLFR